MRAILYHLIMMAGSNALKAIGVINSIVAKTTYHLAKFVCKEQAEYYDALMPQINYLSELKLIQETFKVRDDALEEDDWNGNHYQHLNYLMSSLHEFHGWEKSDIDDHMTLLVKSGPEGYEYEPSDIEEE